MKNIFNKLIICFTLISTIGFTNCTDTNEDLNLELTIEAKIELLESNEWLLKDFEDRVMHTFSDGKRFTYYGTANIFTEAIPGTNDYTISGDFLTIDFNFGNIKTYEVKFSCDNSIVEFFVEGELNNTLYKRGSNYLDCL